LLCLSGALPAVALPAVTLTVVGSRLRLLRLL
jgi:hypothetical protein